MKGSVSGDKGPVGDSEKASWNLTVNFPSFTPVVGVEFVPTFHVFSYFHIRNPDIEAPEYTLRCNWHRLEGNGIFLACSKTYVPADRDVGYILKLECAVIDLVTGNPLATNITLTDRVIITPPPHPRQIIQIGSGDQPAGSRTFKVLTYNVLGDYYATIGGTCNRYCYCPKWALTWQYRRQNLLREIIGYDADIICLQEVQSDHFEDFFTPELERHGYSAIYHKTINPVCFARKHIHDGCATFFREDRFKAVQKHEIEFSKTAERYVDELPLNKREDGAKRLKKDNVALIVVLESKEGGPVPNMLQSRSSQLICVANTHIQSNPELTDVKLMQVADLLLNVERITHSVATSYCRAAIPVLICGDLNSRPESAVHELVALKSVHPNHPARKDDPFGLFQQTKLSHNMSLVSAYTSFLRTDREEPDVKCQQKLIDPKTKEPLCTFFTERSVGTLDYIFYSEDTLVVDGLLELLDEELLGEDTALPSPRWSSDHIALMGSFRIGPETHGVH